MQLLPLAQPLLHSRRKPKYFSLALLKRAAPKRPKHGMTQPNEPATPTPHTQPLLHWPHYAVLALGVLTFVLLLTANRTALNTRNATVGATRDGAGVTTTALTIEGVTLAALPQGPDGEVLRKLQAQLAESQTPDEKIQLLNKLVSAAMNANRPDVAALYAERSYSIDATDARLNQALGLYKAAIAGTAATTDTSLLHLLAPRALALMDTYLQAKPADVDAQVDRALLQVQAARQPADMMNGIRALRTVADANPAHLRANLQMGVYSLQTGQLEKAEARLRQVLTLDGNHAEAHLYLAQTLARQGKTAAAITEYDTAAKLTQDPTLRTLAQSERAKLKPQ